jgi:hypothetical protein
LAGLTLLDASSISASDIWAGDVASSGEEGTSATRAPVLMTDDTFHTANKLLSKPDIYTVDLVTFAQESLSAKGSVNLKHQHDSFRRYRQLNTALARLTV